MAWARARFLGSGDVFGSGGRLETCILIHSEACSCLLDCGASGAGLFICESYFYEKQVPFHLAYATLMKHRTELECTRIVLTHMSSDMLSHLPLQGAHDGLEITL